MYVIIDNYDSFTHNLYQYLRELTDVPVEVIDSLEPVRRGFYAGVVAHVESDGSLDSCISIRCAVRQGDVVTLQAGAGIVADSVPEKEYGETEAKLGALARAIGLEA